MLFRCGEAPLGVLETLVLVVVGLHETRKLDPDLVLDLVDDLLGGPFGGGAALLAASDLATESVDLGVG